MSGDCLRITVRTRTGQTVDDLEKAVPAIRDAVGHIPLARRLLLLARSAWNSLCGNCLSSVETARQPTSTDATAVEIGRRENGSAWILRVAGLHTLTVGCSGAGKGSIFWGIAGGLGPAIKAGTVRLFAIDLKYGIEVSVGSAAIQQNCNDTRQRPPGC